MLAVEEIERILREYAKPDEELGWPGSEEIADQAEGIASFIVDNYPYSTA